MLRRVIKFPYSVDMNGTTLASEASARDPTARAARPPPRAIRVPCTKTRVGGNKKARDTRLQETTMLTPFVPSRPSLLALALVSSSLATAFAQEVAGQAQAMGAPVPKAISVSQQQLDAADKDAANFLHSNMSYAQTRYH